MSSVMRWGIEDLNELNKIVSTDRNKNLDVETLFFNEFQKSNFPNKDFPLNITQLKNGIKKLVGTGHIQPLPLAMASTNDQARKKNKTGGASNLLGRLLNGPSVVPSRDQNQGGDFQEENAPILDLEKKAFEFDKGKNDDLIASMVDRRVLNYYETQNGMLIWLHKNEFTNISFKVTPANVEVVYTYSVPDSIQKHELVVPVISNMPDIRGASTEVIHLIPPAGKEFNTAVEAYETKALTAGIKTLTVPYKPPPVIISRAFQKL